MNETPTYGENLNPPEPKTAAWSPTALALIAILLNFWPASIFHALNYERLGAPELKTPRLIQYSLLGVIFCMLVIAAGLTPGGARLGYLPMVANLAFGWHFYKSQRPLYEKHLASGGKRASVVAPLATALVFALGVGGLTVAAQMIADSAFRR